MSSHGYPTLPIKMTQGMISNFFGSGLVCITLQSIIYDKYTTADDIGDALPSPTYGESWTLWYTSVILASGIVDILVGCWLFCILSRRTKKLMCLGLLFVIVAGAMAVASSALSALELGRLYSTTEGHVCREKLPDTKRRCAAWWWMELFVIIFSVNAAGSAVITVGCLLIAFCGGR